LPLQLTSTVSDCGHAAKVCNIGASAPIVADASGVAAPTVSGQAEHFRWAGLAAVASGLTAEANLPSGPLQLVGDSSGHFARDLAGGLLSGVSQLPRGNLLRSGWLSLLLTGPGSDLARRLDDSGVRAWQGCGWFAVKVVVCTRIFETVAWPLSVGLNSHEMPSRA
jgi:hypothetical protein